MSELSLVHRQLLSLRFQSCPYGRPLGVAVDCFFDKLVDKDARCGLAMYERRGTKDRLAVGRQTNVDLRVFATHVGRSVRATPYGVARPRSRSLARLECN